MRIVSLIVVIAMSMLAAAGARAAGGVSAREGWIREAPPSAPTRAGYLTLANDGDSAVRIAAARSEAFGAIEIHEMREGDDGVMRMRRLERLELPAGATVKLEPGGLHLMLFRPTRPLAGGERVPLVLETDAGERIETTLEQR